MAATTTPPPARRRCGRLSRAGHGPSGRRTLGACVRQRVWQHSGALFSLGNPFLVDTLEPTTGRRLIAVVDKNVWSCYGEQMGAWADSVVERWKD